MEGRQYLGIIIAQSQSPKQIQMLRKEYQELYTRLSPLQKVQFSTNESSSTSRSQSFQEMSKGQKAAMIGNAAISVAGAVGGAVFGGKLGGLDKFKETIGMGEDLCLECRFPAV